MGGLIWNKPFELLSGTSIIVYSQNNNFRLLILTILDSTICSVALDPKWTEKEKPKNGMKKQQICYAQMR